MGDLPGPGRVGCVLVVARRERESELTHVHPLDISTTRHFPAACVTSRLRYRSGLALGVKLGDALISDDASDDWLDWLRSASEEYNRIVDVMTKYAVHFSGISFTCKKHGEHSADLVRLQRSPLGTA